MVFMPLILGFWLRPVSQRILVALRLDSDRLEIVDRTKIDVGFFFLVFSLLPAGSSWFSQNFSFFGIMGLLASLVIFTHSVSYSLTRPGVFMTD